MLAIQKGNHNFGGTAHCRVPLKQRAPQQKVSPNVQTGCISCASCDSRFGGPIWWNTPTPEDDDDNDDDDDDDGHEPGSKRARPDGENDDDEDEEEMPEEVKKRLAALKEIDTSTVYNEN